MGNYSYIISKNGSTTQAKNITTNAIEFANSSSNVVFNNVINTMSVNGGGAAVKNGIYEVDNNILAKSFTGLVGESMDKTIIRAKAGFNDNNLFRYWAGASSTPLQGFKLRNLKLELNVNNATESAWISSGTKDLEVDHVWVYSKKTPAVSTIGFFIDTANNTNNNTNTVIQNCVFEGPCNEQDFLGCGNLVDCDFSNNLFLNTSAQAIGIGGTNRSIISNNRFENTGNAIGYEWKCENNIISDNICYNTKGIKLSGGWETNSIHWSRNNKCINNQFNYGEGGIEAAISIDDEISGNKFYRTLRNGIQGSFLRTVIKNNIFTDTNWDSRSEKLLGSDTLQRTGGIMAFNSNTTMMPKNEWNSFSNNYFVKSGVKFTIPGSTGQQEGFTGGVVIDTKYLNSFINGNEGNLGADMLKNYGTKAP